ncbi:GIY-YIG nuclease family protein [Alicyclobacillus tolerans]|uniref:GIY-YIG nuclease family protein n=1 Tax=Alicyclobacillus tolerans TaxID=90970 RepID=UPI001F1D1DB4|nr:GIY-YIG nuclease family protein [Alicyclobacillus tolerans]MCF8566581.1 GIY-YIG nuclease family protein [Alicyclobacillus tolerans]
MAEHFVYILKCCDGTLYTGYTTDIPKRVSLHNQGKASKYTRSRLPALLVYVEPVESRSEGLKREYRIKRLSRAQKEQLIVRGALRLQEFLVSWE